MRRALFAVALVCLSISLFGQVTIPAPIVPQQFLDNTGTICSGCFLYTYSAGTSTPLATYTDSTGTSQNTDPITLDSSGRASIWLGNNSYKFVLQNASSVTLWTQDNINEFLLLGRNNVWSGTQTFNGAVTFGSTSAFSGAVTVKSLNSIRFADQFSGSDCGAKINAAEADLGSTGGEIWVNQACGTVWTTAVVISNTAHVLRFVQGGTYTCSPGASNSCVTLSGPDSSIIGNAPAGTSGGGVNAATILKAADSAGITTAVLILSGANANIVNLIVDGNQAGTGTASGGSAIKINNANRWEVLNSSGQNASGNGLYVLSNGTSNASCCGRVINSQFVANQKDGVFSQGTADVFFLTNEVENNLVNGIELSDSGSWRIVHSDLGGNGSGGGTCGGIAEVAGLCVYGTAAGTKSNTQIVSSTQFGNQLQHDIMIVGYDTVGGATTSSGNTIEDCTFIGGNGADATYSSIKLVDGGQNTLVGNFLGSSTAPHRFTNAIAWSETSSGRTLTGGRNGSNTANANFSSSIYSDTTTNGASGTQITVNNGASSSALDLFDIASGDATPHKYFKIQSGTLQIVDSAFANNLLTLDDSGNAVIKATAKAQAFIVGGTSATLTGTGACATRSNQLGGATAGEVKCTGTTGASTLTITTGITATNGWSCWGSDTTTALAGVQTTRSTTAPVLTFSSVTANDVLTFGCIAY